MSGQGIKGNKEITFNRILDLMGKRLEQPGLISANDAWVICRGSFGYSTITQSFKKIMTLMQEQGKAQKVKNGQWIITGKIYPRM